MAGRKVLDGQKSLLKRGANDEDDADTDDWHVAYNKPSAMSATDNGDRIRHASNISAAQRSVQSRIEDLELDDAGFVDQRPRFRGGTNRKAFIGICVGVLLGVAAVVCVVVFYFRSSQIPNNHIIVVDAGSSQTKFYVFHYRGDKQNGTGKIEQIAYQDCNGTLVSFVKDAEGLRAAWKPCLEFARAVIPEDRRSKMEVYVGATAGVRQLKKQNSKGADQLLNEVRLLLNQTYNLPADQTHVLILDGEEEGALGWATVNFVSKKLLPDNINLLDHPHETYGSLDLGGSSTQIAFATDDLAGATNFELTFFGSHYRLYSKSFACRGKGEAHRVLKARLVSDQSTVGKSSIPHPCYPAGSDTTESHSELFKSHCTNFLDAKRFHHRTEYHLTGTGNVTECRLLVNDLFDATKCPISDLDCSHSGQLRNMNISGPFMGFAGLYFVMDFFNLTHNDDQSGVKLTVKPSDFRAAYTHHCELPWMSDYFQHSANKFIKGYCFDGVYIDTLLNDIYGFSDEQFERIEFRSSVNGVSTGWAVGLALNSTNSVPPEVQYEMISKTFFLIFLVIFAVFLVLAISFLCRGVRRSCRDTSI